MALVFLPIQASAVPSERVFSLSAETDTSKRNRISPALMEALQMLKFSECFFYLHILLYKAIFPPQVSRSRDLISARGGLRQQQK
jgi:hypothetical protein